MLRTAPFANLWKWTQGHGITTISSIQRFFFFVFEKTHPLKEDSLVNLRTLSQRSLARITCRACAIWAAKELWCFYAREGMLPHGSPNFCTSKGSSYDPQIAGGLQFHNQKNFKIWPTFVPFFGGPWLSQIRWVHMLACICVFTTKWLVNC